MALSKKKGSFTLNDGPAGDPERASGKTGSGANALRVVLLDGSFLTIGSVDKKMLGQVAFDQVVRKLDLLERDYFGLLYEDDHKAMQWLDFLKPIKKQLRRQPYTLFFRVKFYAVDPLALHKNSKEQFYLQLKEDICAGRLPFPSESAHSVLSYVLQADVGDYRNTHDDLQYLERKGLLVLGKDRTAESSVIKLHKLLQGKTSDQAVEKFLRKARELDSYGAKFNIVQYEGIPYRMGMSPSGITLYQDTTRAAHFKWRKVLQVSYKQKRFTLTLKSKSTEGGEKTVICEVESAKQCKDMWKLCVERVSFYNDHQTRYMERSERGNDRSRSPSPPTSREYATINDATPQLKADRQKSIQSSPVHSSQQDEHHSQRHNEQQSTEGRSDEGARQHRDRGERHRGRRREKEQERLENDHDASGTAAGDKSKHRRRERGGSGAHRYSRSPPGNGGLREGSEEREGGDMSKRRSRSHSSKMHSLPRRLPTGDPILHHMMQFQGLESHSSRGTLLSDSDSAVETTSPIVSTCDEISECPEPTRMHHWKPSTEPEVGHVRSFSLPQQSSNEQWRYRSQDQPDEDARVQRRGQRVRGAEAYNGGDAPKMEDVQDRSISEEREGEQSIHDSLEELADLLGDDEVPREIENGHVPKEETPESVTEPTPNPPHQKHTSPGDVRAAGITADQSPPELNREEREKRRRQKQLQKQILLQRQQMKEQKLQEYLEKRKQGRQRHKEPAEESQRHSEKRRSKEKKGEHEEEAVAHAGEIGRGRHSLKGHRHDSHEGPPTRRQSDTAPRDVMKERKKEEREMVRSWARAHRKTQRETHASPAKTVAQEHVQPNSYPDTTAEEPLYNRLAPLHPKEVEAETAEAETRQSIENLPSSPPPPPYKSPSPAHQAAMGIVSHEIDGSSEAKEEAVIHESPIHQRSISLHTTSTPPTPRSGERHGGSRSTLISNNSPRSVGSGANRPRYTQSFSGTSPMNSSAGSAAGSPHTPTRARSLKTTQYSPAKQNSPALIPKKTGRPYEPGSGSAEPYLLGHAKPPPAQSSNDEMPIPIDPSALQKEDLAIAPHNFLTLSSSPPYDKLAEAEEVEPVPPVPTKVPVQSGTQYKLETALQEVMTSENLPPPPTHLLEISGQLEDIDYDDLDAPPAAVAGSVLPSRAGFEQQKQTELPAQPQKRDINPEMLARSLDAPRNPNSNPTSYPPHIAKFISRVRNSSTDADDPTQPRQPRDEAKKLTNTPAEGEATISDDVFTGISRQQRPASTKADLRPTSGHQQYDIPKSALGRTVSLENANKQTSHPLSVSAARQRSNTFQVGRGLPTSYTLPCGNYIPSAPQEFSGGPRSRETTPSSAHSHTHSDVVQEGNWSTDGQLQSSSTHSFQHSGYTHNGVFRPNPRPPSVLPIQGKRPARGGEDSIPNSPTYFTKHHPHRDEATPSPETQYYNHSFKEHLTSLQPTRGVRRMNVANWMEQSSDYWNSNKSAPFLRDAHTSLPTNPPIRPQHRPVEQRLSLPGPHIPTPAGTPVLGSHHGRQQPVRAVPHTQLAAAAPVHGASLRPFMGRQYNPLASSSSSALLQRGGMGAMGSSQPLPNYPRPHSAKTTTIGDNYYVLDV